MEALQTYGYGHEASIAAKAVSLIKESGKVAVVHHSTPGFGPGYYAYRLRENGTLGLSICTMTETESDAWLSAAIHLAAYKPGELLLTSREFGSTWTANVLCKDGSLGTLERRSRLEIRKIVDRFEVFLVNRSYLEGEEPRDVQQDPQREPFATVADAAAYIDQFISDYVW